MAWKNVNSKIILLVLLLSSIYFKFTNTTIHMPDHIFGFVLGMFAGNAAIDIGFTYYDKHKFELNNEGGEKHGKKNIRKIS